MSIFELNNYSFTYPLGNTPALLGLNLRLEEGRFYVLCGKSGCGKSTLLRQFKTALTPKGETEGEIRYEGRLLSEVSSREQSAQIGFVFQNPDNQIVTDKVWHELAFGLESLGYSNEQIHLRVAEMAAYFGITDWFHRDVAELSGGQKQLLNLASIMTMHPRILLLDEPASQLDPVAAAGFFSTLHKINRELGVTIFLSEHNLEEVIAYADYVFLLEEGQLLEQGTPEQLGRRLRERKHEMFQAMPTAMRIYANTDSSLECPYTVAMGRHWLACELQERELQERKGSGKCENCLDNNGKVPTRRQRELSDICLSLKDVGFRYDRNLPEVISDASLEIYQGETFALMGGNGTGKSTLLNLMSGLLKPCRGEILLENQKIEKYSSGQLYYGLLSVLPQDPTSLFVKTTVREELKAMCPVSMGKEEYRRIIELTQISALLERHPFDLSGGEQQRVALAKVLLRCPKILLLDEPTKGFDAWFKKEFGTILRKLNRLGTTVVMVSHDLEFCAEFADRVGLVFDGGFATVQETKKFFAGNHFYTTAANRMARQFFPEAVTPEEVTERILQYPSQEAEHAQGDENPEIELQAQEMPRKSPEAETKEQVLPGNGQVSEWQSAKDGTKSRASRWYLFLCACLLVPFTIWAGIHYFDDRKYLIISLIIALYALLPFFGFFCDGTLKVQKLVTVAVLTAIAVAGRAAFFMVPSIKPMAAVTILTGIALGADCGFLVGALSMLVSNMLFGQGPWTPWQMFAMGLIGLLAGLLSEVGILSKKRISMCLYGFFATLILYGGIMNPASLVMVSYELTWESILAIYLSGLPMDLVHAVSTVVFLALSGRVVLDKLERVKARYELD